MDHLLELIGQALQLFSFCADSENRTQPVPTGDAQRRRGLVGLKLGESRLCVMPDVNRGCELPFRNKSAALTGPRGLLGFTLKSGLA